MIAERTGDVVVITMEGEGEERTFECRVEEDRCIIMTINDDDGHKMKMMFMREDGEEVDAALAEEDVLYDQLKQKFSNGVK